MPRVSERQSTVCLAGLEKNTDKRQHTNLCTEIQNGKERLDVSKDPPTRRRKG